MIVVECRTSIISLTLDSGEELIIPPFLHAECDYHKRFAIIPITTKMWEDKPIVHTIINKHLIPFLAQNGCDCKGYTLKDS